MFKKQLELHLSQLDSRLRRSSAREVEAELSQARQFLTTTKDTKWRNAILKRIKQLEQDRKAATDTKELVERHAMVKALHDRIKDHPDYNKTRKRRAK
jgi:hypothetical protein